MADYLDKLNNEQREAVLTTEGPLLILAGAGSGKTRVLTYRTAYLISKGVMPWNILAITFTNKAAGEMRERVDRMIPGQGSDVFVSTFHALCVRILRRDIEKLGYDRDFTIYDTDDQRTLMKGIIKGMNLDTASYRERAVLSIISSSKNEMTDASLYEENASDFYERNIAKLYREYERQLKKNNALDFDDLLLLTVELFGSFPDVLSYWQERFRYIMVDEYQDTNGVQFELVRLLSGKYHNLCVVGDDDQSIYRFRGADIENILSFEKSFPGCRVIKLEQNYRSTKAILNAANHVISNNTGRKEKALWTENEAGNLPVYREYDTAGAEAESVINEIRECSGNGTFSLGSQAVLYRTNAQSRLFEEKCVARGIPYTLVGGVNFYQRKEIKDILSYLRVILNGVDDLACERIINVPKRGIGQTTVSRLRDLAVKDSVSFFDILSRTGEIKLTSGTEGRIRSFVQLIEGLRAVTDDPDSSLRELIEAVRDNTGYAEELKKEDPVQYSTRLENIEELITKAVSFSEEQPSLSGRERLAAFLEDVALVSDIDRLDESGEALTMMTLHAAKGLEFPKVYICGMEEGLFPSSMAVNADDPEAEIEEERRLCYVGITRAEKELVLTSSKERMINGDIRYMKHSRFIDEIPEDCLVRNTLKRRYDGFGGGDRRSIRFNDTAVSGSGAGLSFAGNYGGFGSLDRRDERYYSSSGSRNTVGTIKLTKGTGDIKKKPDYSEGDRVSHIKFGTGTVLSVTEGERDFEVSVDFDTAGIKKMFAGFAKLRKL